MKMGNFFELEKKNLIFFGQFSQKSDIVAKQEVGSLAREAQPRLQLLEQLFASIELLL